MHNKLKQTLFTVAILFSSEMTLAASYDTLPKGVRLGGYRHVLTDGINSDYGSSSTESQYALKESLDAKNLESINDATKQYFEQLKSINPGAYDSFTFGEYAADAEGRVSVNGFGLGWGITNNLTAYFSVPIYKANVKLNIHRTKGNNHSETLNHINQNSNLTAEQKVIRDITAQLPDAKEELLQSIIVNYYQYKPIGNWEAQGLGDIEVGAIYKLVDAGDYGLAVAGGVVLPTGREDDPDTLQDISFGDGQSDIFAEVFTGRSFFKRKLDLDLNFRLTYQMSAEKRLRVPESYDFPLSREVDYFKEKLGNKVNLSFGPTYHFTHWASLSSTYGYELQGKSKYESSHSQANDILAHNSDSESHNIRLAASFSTVSLYQMKKFVMPLSVSLRAQKKIAGRNTPKHSQYELDFKFFF
ncbi:conserved hypothetical protein [Halobacteriovorax marinus SJ]|uniref:Uncharacterized protein n=1 Tax=Halobacteriovorax marinus (strain ATCC BAA-682 / DSM 15412 / SJ) TaxID=862908 RepID=E1X4W9_HALMS|nr:hypothetical protein [Halobacteriovorax marinus]CBW27195.1 conserved hypothetical protein [Halobacteriovorax marinus SJ]